MSACALDVASSPEGIVFDVQRFSIHDGPGVRTTVFLKGCPLRCPWCQNPESLRPGVELAFYADRCHGSHACLDTCPQGALQPGPTRVVREVCDGCGACLGACAYGALERIGRRVTVPALVAEVERDRPFFEASGGGVTLSGGEPTYQLGFAVAFAQALRDARLGCGLQTCGAFRWEALAPHLPRFDFVFFDLKLMDPDEHRTHIGADNRAILENARRLVRAGVDVTFRSPMVAGFTDTPQNLAAMAAFLHECGRPRLHLLGYHAMGQAKLARVGFPIPPFSPKEPLRGDALVARAAARLRGLHIEVTT